MTLPCMSANTCAERERLLGGWLQLNVNYKECQWFTAQRFELEATNQKLDGQHLHGSS